MADRDGVTLDANRLVVGSATKASAISWPYPVDHRLDQLVEQANIAGAGTRRQELAAALIALASDEPEELLALVIQWRKLRVREVVLGIPQAAAVVDIPRYPPGRRRPSR